MTSPVDTSVKFMLSRFSGAPVFTPQIGSMIALLDAFLIDGYDTKSATSLVVASGVATLSFSGSHSAELDTVIAVSGVTGSLTALNGEQKVTSAAPGVVKFATAAADGTAAGTISFKMAPVGYWEKQYTGTNVACYRSTHPDAYGRVLRVDDTRPGETRVKGFEAMSDADTGVGQFPLAGQMESGDTNGGWWAKNVSNSSSSNAVGYTLIGDHRIFYVGLMLSQAQGSSYVNYRCTELKGFGDLIANRLSGDPYAVALACNKNSSYASYSGHGSFSRGQINYGGVYLPRDYLGLGTSKLGATLPWMNADTEHRSGVTQSVRGAFPSPVDGSLIYCSRYWRLASPSTESEYSPRAEVPGILTILQSQVFPAINETSVIYGGAGRWEGRRLLPVITGDYGTDVVSSPANAGISLVDVTGPWREV